MTIFFNRSTRWICILGPLALLTLAAGCERNPKVFPISGKISYRGQVPAGAQIVLHAKNGNAPKDLTATGTVKDDGSFKIGAFKSDDGAPPGEYVATVQWFKLTSEGGSSGRGPNVLPPQYANPATSPIHVSVKEAPNELPPIELR